MKKGILLLGTLLLSVVSLIAQTCSAPQFGAFPHPNSPSIFVFWGTTFAPSYTIQYKASGDTTWTSVTTTASTNTRDTGIYTISNLVACKAYTVRMRANCTNTLSSEWSRTTEVKTSGCPEPCRAPINLIAVTRDSMAVLTWTPPTLATIPLTYSVQWRNRRDTSWRTILTTTNSLTVNGLQPCTEYQFRVKTFCAQTTMSDYSEAKTFKTSGCVAPCGTPAQVRVVAAADRSYALLAWTSTGATTYEVQYMVGDSAARSATVTGLTFRLPNLLACKTYKFKVRSICRIANAPVYSEWSATVSITTEGCLRCVVPSRLSAITTANSATLKWDTAVGMQGITYDIQYIGSRDTAWRTVSAVRGNVYTLANLTACTEYKFRVKANCPGTTGSAWSSPSAFKTIGCPPVCSAPRGLRVYLRDTVAVITWLPSRDSAYSIRIVSADNVFVREASVRGFSYNLTGLQRCKTYKVQLKTVCSANLASEIVTASFTTSGCPTPCTTPREVSIVTSDTGIASVRWNSVNAPKYYIEYRLLGDTTNLNWRRDSTTTNSFILRGLQLCTNYQVRIAAVCATGVTSFGSPKTFKTGGCQPICPAPSGLRAEIVNDSTAIVSFLYVQAQAYTVQYRVAGTSAWTTIPVTPSSPNGSPVRLTGLRKCTVYEYRVTKVCGFVGSSESEIKTFTTTGCAATCPVPRSVEGRWLAADSAKVTWIAAASNSAIYEVQYVLVTDSANWSTAVRTSATGLILRGLQSCKTYLVRVRSICNGTVSGWIFDDFRTGVNCFDENLTTHNRRNILREFAVYPNPGTDNLKIAYTLQEPAQIQIELMNMQGQVVNRFNAGNQAEGNYFQTFENLGDRQSGIYLVVLKNNGKVLQTLKWQKQ
jgi:hypothetical protein